MSKRQRSKATPKEHTAAMSVLDAFVNEMTRQGVGMPNSMNGTHYTKGQLTQNYTLLVTLYRENWLIGKIVDDMAEDMTKAWINITSDMSPEAQDTIDMIERKCKIRAKVTEGLRWGRLFGGAAALMMIEGMSEDDLFEPLDLTRVMPGSFKGLLVADRWAGVQPELDLVKDIGDPEFGQPEWYDFTNAATGRTYIVHHSHLLLFKGRQLPDWEEMSTQMWGASEIETVFDEIKKRDNTSANLAGLIFRANINVQKMDGLGQMLGLGDTQALTDLYGALSAQNQLMNNFSTYVMDSNDDFTTIQNTTFTGLNDIYESFMMDVCGATGYPMTKLFGRSPAGMDATGEGDLQNYDDLVSRKQESQLRPIIEKLLPVVFMSTFGQVPKDIQFRFNSSRTPNEKDIAELVDKKAHTVIDAYTAGLLTQKIGMQELQEMGKDTGMFTNIKDEDIEQADDELDEGDMPGMDGMPGQVPPGTGLPGQPGTTPPPPGQPPKNGQGATNDSVPFPIGDEDRWITVGGGESDNGEHGGRHVKIDEHGNIVGGSIPRAMQGKNIDKAFSKGNESEPVTSKAPKGDKPASYTPTEKPAPAKPTTIKQEPARHIPTDAEIKGKLHKLSGTYSDNPIPTANADDLDAFDDELRAMLKRKRVNFDTIKAKKTANVPISSLKTTQDVVQTEKVCKLKGWTPESMKSDDTPKVVRYKGQNYLMDGNHRTVASMLRGDKTVPAWYYDLDAGHLVTDAWPAFDGDIPWDESKHPRSDDGKFGEGGGAENHVDKLGERYYTEIGKKVDALKEKGLLNEAFGIPTKAIPVKISSVNKHGLKHGVTREEAQSFIDNARIMMNQGNRNLYISQDGNAAILTENKRLISAYKREDFDPGIKALMEAIYDD